MDAKYEAEKPAGFPNADVYQALAYATSMGLEEAHLVYAKGNEPVQSYRARGTGVAIHAHVLDLSQSPEALLEQVTMLAPLVGRGAG